MTVRPVSQARNHSQKDDQGIDVQAVIDSLMNRVQQLTVENVMLQATVNQLTRQEVDSGADHSSPMGS